MAGGRRHLARVAAARAGDVDLAQTGVGPAHEDERLAVARPTRPQLHRAVLGARQPPRGAAGRGLDPELAERFEDDAAAVGRHFGPARHFRHKAVGRDFDRGVRRVDDHAVVIDAERTATTLAAVAAYAAQLAAGPADDIAADRKSTRLNSSP